MSAHPFGVARHFRTYMTKFSDLALDPRVLQAVMDAGYETPTPSQAQAIPPVSFTTSAPTWPRPTTFT